MQSKLNFRRNKYGRFFHAFLVMVLALSTYHIADAEWIEPKQNPPLGNVSGPLWLSPTTTQDGYIDISSVNNPAISVRGEGDSGIISIGQEYGIVGTGTTAGLRGIGTGTSSFGIYGQAAVDGYAAGFDGPVILTPQNSGLSAGNQGAIFYQNNNDVNKVYFCSLDGGCESSEDWVDLVYGAFTNSNGNIALGKENFTLNGFDNSPFYVNSDRTFQVRINADQESADGVFSINNSDNKTVLSVNDSGNLVIPQGSSITLGGETITSWDQLFSGQSSTSTSNQTNTSTGDTNNTDTSTNDSSGDTGSSSNDSTSGDTSSSSQDSSSDNNSDDTSTSTSGLTLNGAYNWGGAGAGRTITADSGAVNIIGSNNNSLEVLNSTNDRYAGFFSASGVASRAVYGIATSTDSAAVNYGGYFVSQGSSGVGVYGEGNATNAVGVSGSALNGGIAGQFIAQPFGGLDIGVFASGSTALMAQGDLIGADIGCLGENCIGLSVNGAETGEGSIGLYVGGYSGLAAQFVGQEVIFGDVVSGANPDVIKQNGDVYVQNNLEVDGVICLGDECRETWGSSDGGYWTLADDEAGVTFMYPNSASRLLVGQDTGTELASQYPLTVDSRLLIGRTESGLDTGLFFDASAASQVVAQAKHQNETATLALNPNGGVVTVGQNLAGIEANVAIGDGDLYVAGDIEVEGNICFAGTSDCASTWPEGSGGGGSDSDWVIVTPSGAAAYLYSYGSDVGATYFVGIGEDTPLEMLDVEGAINIGSTESTNLGTIRYYEDDFQGYSSSGWNSLTSGGGAWTSGVNGLYYNDAAILVGSDTAHTLSDPNLGAQTPGDLFAEGFVGAELALSTDGTLFVGGTTTLGNDTTPGGDYIYMNGRIAGALPFVFEGNTQDTFDTTFAITDPTADRTITFQDESGTVAFLTDIGATWTDGTNGTYHNTEAVIVGADSAETIDNALFASDGLLAGDLFVESELGVEGDIYTDSGFNAGSGVTLNDVGLYDNNSSFLIQSINDSINLTAGGASGDYINLDEGTFIVDSFNNTASLGVIPTASFMLEVDGGSAKGGINIANVTTNSGVYASSSSADTTGLEANVTGTDGIGVYSYSELSNAVYALTASDSVAGLVAAGSGGVETALAAQFVSGAVQIGAGAVPTVIDNDGDLYVLNDLEIDGYASIGDGDDLVCVNRGTCSTYSFQVGDAVTNGNGAYVTDGGTWTNGSSRTFKDRFVELDNGDVLNKILGLSVTGWHYKQTQEYHIGPVAEDFYETFGTGLDEKYLAASDMGGVALIGIKALNQKIENLEVQVQQQQQLIDDLLQRVEALERE